MAQNSVYTRCTMQTEGSTYTGSVNWNKRETIESSFHPAHVCAHRRHTFSHNDAFFSLENWNFGWFLAHTTTQNSIKKDIGGVQMQQRMGHTDDLTHDNKIISSLSLHSSVSLIRFTRSPRRRMAISSFTKKKKQTSRNFCTCWIYLDWNALRLCVFFCVCAFAFKILYHRVKSQRLNFEQQQKCTSFFTHFSFASNQWATTTTKDVQFCMDQTARTRRITDDGQSKFEAENRQYTITIALKSKWYGDSPVELIRQYFFPNKRLKMKCRIWKCDIFVFNVFNGNRRHPQLYAGVCVCLIYIPVLADERDWTMAITTDLGSHPFLFHSGDMTLHFLFVEWKNEKKK